MSTLRVSSAEFLKSYGRISEAALKEPVTITSHGRERLVLMSAEAYRKIRRSDRVALRPWELSKADIAALEVAEPSPEGLQFDHEVDQD